MEILQQNLPESFLKSVLANQVRPHQAFKVFKEGANVRVTSRPGETYPYGSIQI